MISLISLNYNAKLQAFSDLWMPEIVLSNTKQCQFLELTHLGLTKFEIQIVNEWTPFAVRFKLELFFSYLQCLEEQFWLKMSSNTYSEHALPMTDLKDRYDISWSFSRYRQAAHDQCYSQHPCESCVLQPAQKASITDTKTSCSIGTEESAPRSSRRRQYHEWSCVIHTEAQ